MPRIRKEPKPYTLKSRRGERPYSYSEQYNACRAYPADAEARRQWMRRFSPNVALRDPQFRNRVTS